MLPRVTSPVDAAATDSKARHARLLHAAQQFEGVMLNELMKPLTNSSAIGDPEGGGEAATMQGFGVEAMAVALGKSGALGFAHRIVESLEKRQGQIE